jgi:glycosyltransferase involved in cell wall biosynthesis
MEHETTYPSIAFFLEGERVPSSRFRVEQFQNLLTQDGVLFKNFYTRPTKYLYYPAAVRNTVLEPAWAIGGLAWVVAQRVWQIAFQLRPYQTIFLQRDLLYRVSVPFLEGLLFACASLGKKKRIVFDIDDAIFLGKGGVSSPALQRKIDFITDRCDLVIAGNQYLVDQLSKHEKTVVIPTTIPTDRYVERTKRTPSSLPVIGWTGVASNLPYIAELERVLNALSKRFEFEVHIVCQGGVPSPFREAQFPVTMIAWSPETETSALQNFDIGIMPLQSDEWAKGKCGFKLLQYMAVGLASVASPVGVNKDIISDGTNGLLASSHEDWESCLERLLGSTNLCQQLGSAGVATVRSSYCRDIWYPRWRDAIFGM